MPLNVIVPLPPLHIDAEPDMVVNDAGTKVTPLNGAAAVVVATVVIDVTVEPASVNLISARPAFVVAYIVGLVVEKSTQIP